MVLERTLSYSNSVLVDRDANAVNYLLEAFAGKQVCVIKKDFAGAVDQLVSEGRQFDMVLMDLGVSSPHLDNASRGFSFSSDGPLDMRMDQEHELTAYRVVNEYPEAKLVEIIRQYGEDPSARRIARGIVQHRPILSTSALATVVAQSVGARGKKTKHHPATRTFQAIRIEVNDELTILRRALPLVLQVLAPGGRLGIISFHSLEDRIVKDFMKEYAGERYDATLRLLTKKPVIAAEPELVSNPRARSAKLRVAVKK